MDALIARFGQRYMYVMFASLAVLFYLYGLAAVVSGWWGLLFPGMLVLSPGIMAVLRLCYEGPLNRRFFDPAVMSWTFVVGDCLVLPFMFWFAGRGWQSVGGETATEALWSALASAVTGLMAMGAFRKLDGDRYRRIGRRSALKSPTKVWHDFVVVPVVVATTLWLLVPQFVINASADTALAVICLFVFAALAAVDSMRQPDPRLQHPRWDAKRFEPI